MSEPRPNNDSALPSTDTSNSAENPASRKQSSLFELIDNPYVVLILLFFVMAILGLPVLWKSRGFSLWSKLALSVVVTLYTGLLFFLFFLILLWCYRQISGALA